MRKIVTPEKLAANGTEHGHQMALFCWAAINVNERPLLGNLFAIPNGGLRSRVTASRMKAEGAKAGVPDVFLAVPQYQGMKLYHGLFIEMKTETGRTSPDQDSWILRLTRADYKIKVCRSWIEARGAIENYLAGIEWEP